LSYESQRIGQAVRMGPLTIRSGAYDIASGRATLLEA